MQGSALTPSLYIGSKTQVINFQLNTPAHNRSKDGYAGRLSLPLYIKGGMPDPPGPLGPP